MMLILTKNISKLAKIYVFPDWGLYKKDLLVSIYHSSVFIASTKSTTRFTHKYSPFTNKYSKAFLYVY